MGKTWFITGTSSGIGLHLTEQLLGSGDRVAAAVRRPSALDVLAERHPGALRCFELDVTDTQAVRTVVERAFEHFGRIDVVVNNAGYGLFGAAEELDDGEIRRQLDTNVLGSIAVVRAALPHLRAQGGGRIVQVSSEGGQVAYPNFSVYHATKWGIEGFVEAVRQEVAPFGIQFTIVEPGPTRTSFGANIVNAPALPAYAETPSGEIRRALADGSFALTGDPAKIARVIITSVDAETAPRRLVLGSGAFARVRAALTSRLAELDAQEALALSTDLDA